MPKKAELGKYIYDFMDSWGFFEQQPALQRKTSFSHNLDCQIQVKEREREKERYIPYHSIYFRTVGS